MSHIYTDLPPDFSVPLNLDFLRRSPKELLHRIDGDKIYKAIRIEDQVLPLAITFEPARLAARLLKGTWSVKTQAEVVRYLREWFDLDTDLKPFYALARKDELLRPLASRFRGYRIIGQPDLFESLIWAVLGQQINLQFAYTLKQRFVENFGERVEVEGASFFLFPAAETVAVLQPEALLALQFSRQKAAYTIGIAQAFSAGQVSKEMLAGLTLEDAKAHLREIKGIGNWTANYALMKTFRYPDAFPLEDAGLHNAIKNQLGLKAKPDLKKVQRLFKKYKGWEAYATLYLWKSL